jgi:hypothetical protein
MFGGIQFQDDIEAFRKDVRLMTDEKLIETGKACRDLCGPESNYGRPPRDVWTEQLKILREEWRRRHSKIV